MTKQSNMVFDLQKLFDEMKYKAQNSDVKNSYSAYLTSLESEDVAKKFMEEAFELSLAGIENKRHKVSKQQVINEAADVIYHMLALLINCNTELGEVLEELKRRNQKNKADYDSKKK